MKIFNFYFQFSPFFKMERKVVRESISTFYQLHHHKGKLYTYEQFKHCGMAKSSIYDIMARFDKRGTVEHQKGAGPPKKLSKQTQKKLFAEVNHKSGVSQRKLASKYKVCQQTISNTLKAGGIKYRKKIPVPKATPVPHVGMTMVANMAKRCCSSSWCCFCCVAFLPFSPTGQFSLWVSSPDGKSSACL